MAGQVRTPIPHLFGPPGCGKSTFVETAAELLGVGLHSINVSRISPLELEGVQMPIEGKLELMLATYWNNLKAGDILFLDEFLRGFPEVYNGLLDILTSRVVAGHELPPVFIVAASNSTVAYDAALTDRLLHLNVPDPRSNTAERQRIAKTIVSAIGMVPSMAGTSDMDNLLSGSVLPMYAVLDSNVGANATSAPSVIRGTSPRNLIGQALLTEVQDPRLAALLKSNNAHAIRMGYPQYVRLFYHGDNFNVPDPRYISQAKLALEGDKLTPFQRERMLLNMNLLKAHEVITERNKDNGQYDDDIFAA